MAVSYNTLEVNQNNSGILRITLSRPDKLNALNSELLNELHQILITAQTDKQIKAILITGAGKAFCAGADISQLASLTPQQGYEFAKKGQAIFRALEQLGKPSLAAINGYAFGGGCELSMSTTLRICSTYAQFGQPEVKLGVIPGYGGTQRLARLVGKGRALDLCLTGRFIKAEEALQWGLVTEITPAENLISRAEEILNGIIQLAPLAISSAMTVIDIGHDLNLTDALELEATHFAMLCGTHDKQIGTTAFLNKQTAEFSGT